MEIKGLYILYILAMLASLTYGKIHCETYATYKTYCPDGYYCCNDDKCCLPSNDQNAAVIINIDVESIIRAGPVAGITIGGIVGLIFLIGSAVLCMG